MNILRKIRLSGFIATVLSVALSGCIFVRESSKNGFNDGIYRTGGFYGKKVYVLKVDDDTISVFPLWKFKDSTAILTNKRTNYLTKQRKMKDQLAFHKFYRPSFDLDLMTLAMKYRPAIKDIPNQLTTGFNGALFFGYRIDAYKLKYHRTPLNVYNQSIKHLGYSAGVYAGIGNTAINGSVLNDPNSTILYDGVLLIAGVAANIAVEKITFGLSLGADHLLDHYHTAWIYEGKPTIGFTLGLNLK